MGNNALIFIGDSCFKGKILIFTNCLCYIGNALGQSATNMSLNITSESYCIIGNDCLFSWGICIENSDHHPIFDCQTHTCLNVSHRNCLIGDHVWVGQWAWILKNTFLASGSIMGAKAVATKTYYSNTANVGIPARQTRKGVFWNRSLIKDSTKEKIKQFKKLNFEIIKSPKLTPQVAPAPNPLQERITHLESILFGTATTRIQNHLNYQLGQILIQDSKSLFGISKLPFKILLTILKHKNKQKQYQTNIKNNPHLKLPPLESYPDYKESLKIKNHFSYKLGEAFLTSISAGGGGFLPLYAKRVS